MANQFRAAAIGAGAISRASHIPALQAAEGVSLVAVCDVNYPRAQAVAKEFNIPRAYPDAATMLAAESPDLVSIGVPNHVHRSLTIAALQQGAHVMCEKPMALRYADALAMVEAANAAGKVLSVGHVLRYYAPLVAMYERITSGSLGEVYYVKASYMRRSGIPGYGSWFTNQEQAGGGCMLDIGCHILDLSLWFLGHAKPLSVSASLFSKFGVHGKGLGGWGADHFPPPARCDVEDLATIFVRFEGGATLVLDTAWASHNTDGHRVQVYGTEGGLEFRDNYPDPSQPVHLFSERDGELIEEPLPFTPVPGDLHTLLVADWVDAIRTRREPRMPGREAAEVVRIIEAVYTSAATGREVVL
ncbi:MAG: Gfo/Idh/MocA family oxidoreductase [Chloroflexi bacterium]|nr:Gfo/Idh/MocA family oxidoreductase [Chloroflexota bacterium]